MGALYWIKLYHEILNDPKMGRLGDRLWRRVIECFLLAGQQAEGGYLPAVEDMAWTLRCAADELEAELAEIAQRTGILAKRDGRWFVVNFAARQAAVPSTERVRAHRWARRTAAADVTGVKRNVTEVETLDGENETDVDTDAEAEQEGEKDAEAASARPAGAAGDIAPPPGPVGSSHLRSDNVLAYHQRLSGIGLNAAQAALLAAGVESLGAEKVRKAIKDWLERGYKPWNVQGMLQVARNGWDRDGPRSGNGRSASVHGPDDFKTNLPEWVKR
jgi:hypothetical protein